MNSKNVLQKHFSGGVGPKGLRLLDVVQLEVLHRDSQGQQGPASEVGIFNKVQQVCKITRGLFHKRWRILIYHIYLLFTVLKKINILIKNIYFILSVLERQMPGMTHEKRNGIISGFRLGSGCSSIGRAVTSDTRGPRLKSSYWQNLY